MKTNFLRLSVALIAGLITSCSSDSSSNPVQKTKVKITGYQITSIPTTNSGTDWDALGGLPDVYVGIFNGTSTLVHKSSVVNDVPQSGFPLSENFNSPYYSVPSFTDVITVVVMDDDLHDTPSNDDDEIGYVSFVMNDYTTGSNAYPSQVAKANSNGVMIVLKLAWE